MTFDPFGLCSRYISESILYKVIRFAMTATLLLFLLVRVRQYPLFAVKALWLAESALFAVLLLAFLVRSTPVNRSSGVREIIIPLLGSALPFALLLTPPAPAVISNKPLLITILWGMAAATTLTVTGIWSLRRSFSITVEARALVTSGPYRFVRHPVYSGELLAAAAVTAIRISPGNLLILALFSAIQLYRTSMEERKLAETFPEYRDYAKGSFWLWR